MRRSDPILWATGLILALTWTVSLVESIGWIDRPFPGFLVLENRVVASAGLSHWPATADGEIYQTELAAVNGLPLRDVSELHRHVAERPVGTVVRYEFQRGEERFERFIPTRRFERIDFFLLFGSMLMCAAIFGATALGIRFLRRDRMATGAFALLATSAVWGATAPDLYGPYRLFRLHALAETFLFASALHMAWVFPHPARLLDRVPRAIGSIYGVALLLAAANQIGLQEPAAYVVTHAMAAWALGLALFVLIASHVRHFVRPPDFEARQRVKVVTFGAVAALAPAMFVALANWVTGRDAAQNAIAFSAPLFPVSIGYAVLRHNLLEVDAFLRRTVTYALVTASATAAYVLLAGTFDRFVQGSVLEPTEFGPAAGFFTLFALLLLLRDKVQGGIDRVFFRSAYDFKRVVERVSSKLAGAADLELIRNEIQGAASEALHPESLALYLSRAPCDGLAAWGTLPDPPRSGSEIAMLAAAADGPSDMGEGELIVPFRVDGWLIAALALGRPLSGRLYGGDDRRLLQTLANQGAVAIRNALALEELRDLNRDLEAKVEERTHELRKTQAQLVHQEKMASLGQFVAGIAHELNNPLNFIQGNLYHLREYVATLRETLDGYDELIAQGLEPEALARETEGLRRRLDLEFVLDDVAAVFDGCGEGLSRSTTLVKDLRTFSRLDHPDHALVDIHEALDSTVNLLRSKLIGIEVEKEYGDLPAVECIGGQVNQVFMNLIANAADALDAHGGGTIWIRTSCAEDECVRVEIADDGPGVDPELVSRIFDPFFTTKEVGRGTGLGLSISYAIVQRHGGRLDVEPRDGGGSRFWLEIPIRAPEAIRGSDAHEIASEKGSAQRSGRADR